MNIQKETQLKIEKDFLGNQTNRFLGASVNGKPTVSKTVTAGSIPAAPAKESYSGGCLT